ncbi:MAG TPA: hypothetical protein VGD37_05265 [Kofleriaceae bacterium]|jgi:hypothetical protein
MKPIFWVVSAVLSALAYVTGPAISASDDSRAELAAVAGQPPPIDDGDAVVSPQPADMSSCRATCAERYHVCLSASEDAVSDCTCFDASIGCDRGCGEASSLSVRC